MYRRPVANGTKIANRPSFPVSYLINSRSIGCNVHVYAELRHDSIDARCLTVTSAVLLSNVLRNHASGVASSSSDREPVETAAVRLAGTIEENCPPNRALDQYSEGYVVLCERNCTTTEHVCLTACSICTRSFHDFPKRNVFGYSV